MEVDIREGKTRESRKGVMKSVRFDLGPDVVRISSIVLRSLTTVESQTIYQPRPQDDAPTHHRVRALVVAPGTEARPEARHTGTNARPSKARLLSPSSDIENDVHLQSSSPTTVAASSRKTLLPRNLPDASSSDTLLTPPTLPNRFQKEARPQRMDQSGHHGRIQQETQSPRARTRLGGRQVDGETCRSARPV